ATRRGLDRTGPFALGDKVQLADTKDRLHTITLKDGGEFHTHRGVLRHQQLIGAEDGVVVEDNHGTRYQALRPLYSDYMLSMPRRRRWGGTRQPPPPAPGPAPGYPPHPSGPPDAGGHHSPQGPPPDPCGGPPPPRGRGPGGGGGPRGPPPPP